MLKIAILEDEPQYAEQIHECLERFQKEYKIPVEYTCFGSGDTFLHRYRCQFDLLLLDIQMPFIDGMRVAEEVRKMDEKTGIIFITSAGQYAVRGYKVGALDYILKPVEYFVLSQSILRASRSLSDSDKKYLNLKIKSGMVRIDLDHLYYIESRRHTLEVHTADGIYETYGTMKELEEKLGGDCFMRGNKGYLINLRHITAIKENAVIVDGKSLALSRNRRELCLNRLMEYWEETRL